MVIYITSSRESLGAAPLAASLATPAAPPRRIAVVGASAAGLAAAETLRREGFTGAITLIGDEPEPPYDRPPLSKQILRGDWQPDRLALRRTTDLNALDLDLRLNLAATGLDVPQREDARGR